MHFRWPLGYIVSLPLSEVCSLTYRRLGSLSRPVFAGLLLLILFSSEASAGVGTSPLDEGIAQVENDEFRVKGPLVTLAAFASAPANSTGTFETPTGENVVLPFPQPATVENLTPDWSGVWRDAGTFLGTQFVATGIIFTTPESFSGWSSQQKKDTFRHYSENFHQLVWDKDKFYINYVLHPYWGATYYTRGRERGLGEVPSFVYSTLLSAMYEFGPECFFEKPSIQDLIVTPVVGSLLGAYVFEPWRNFVKRKQELHWYDHVVLVATDPLGVLSLGVEKMFGIKSTIMVDYSVPQLRTSSIGSAMASHNNRIGIVVQVPFK